MSEAAGQINKYIAVHVQCRPNAPTYMPVCVVSARQSINGWLQRLPFTGDYSVTLVMHMHKYIQNESEKDHHLSRTAVKVSSCP